LSVESSIKREADLSEFTRKNQDANDDEGYGGRALDPNERQVIAE
jgi:hypothetical protein